jgi:F-type H+-transporting ATPase subunit a
MLNTLFAADIHVSLKAEELFKLGPLTVTNSIVYGTICALFIIIFMIYMARRIQLRPKKGLSAVIEMITEHVIGILEGPFGNRDKAVKYAPYFGVFFLFIMFNNLLGLLPIVGPGIYSSVEGATVPLLRPFTADLNGTLAMAVFAIVLVQYLSIKEQGSRFHLRHYFSDKPKNPINLFIGILEVFGEFTRIVSLSLRLFLNTAVGEILVSVFTSMIIATGRTPIAVIPILLFEMLVAYIQAYVFMVLTATYLGLAVGHHDSHNDHHSAAKLTNRLAEDGKGTNN